MQFERTNGRCEDLAVQLSFHCRISLHFAPSRLRGSIRLGRGAWAPQAEGMSVGKKQGAPEEIPAIISLVVSRYRKNIQVWEKTYPECRGWGGDGGRGRDGGPLRIRTSSRRPGRAERGGQRRPAARGASLPTSPGSSQSFASSPSSTGMPASTNPVRRPGLGPRPPPRTEPAGLPGTTARGSRGLGLGARGREAAPRAGPRLLRAAARPRLKSTPPRRGPVASSRWRAGAAAAAAATAASPSAALGVAGRGRGAAGRRTWVAERGGGRQGSPDAPRPSGKQLRGLRADQTQRGESPQLPV